MNIVDEIKRFVDANGSWTGSASEMIERGFNCAAPNRLSRDIGAVKGELSNIGIIVETGKKQGKRFISLILDDNNSIVLSSNDSIVHEHEKSIVQSEPDDTANPIVHDPIVHTNMDDTTDKSIVQASIEDSIVQESTVHSDKPVINALTESNITYDNGGELTKLIPVPDGLSVDDIFQAPEAIRRRWRCPDRCAELKNGFCGMLGDRQEAVYSRCPNYGIPVKAM